MLPLPVIYLYMDNKRLLDLLDKYLTGALSPGEQTELEAWYEDHLTRGEDWPEAETPDFKASLLQEIHKRTRMGRLRRLWLPAAAACVLVLAGVGLLVVRNRNETGRDQVAGRTPAAVEWKWLKNNDNKEKEL